MIRGQTIGKEAPAYPDNEDAWRADERAGLYAVADGAGGTGLYAGEWARFLVGRVPAEPFRSLPDLSQWLDGQWSDFFGQFQPRAAAHYLTERKFMDEGSGATLAALHFGNGLLDWSVYGDAVVLCFNPQTGNLQASRPGLSQFEQAPHLLNWNESARAEGFAAGQWTHEPGNQYTLLTDALGQFVLMAYEAFATPSDELQQLARQPTALGGRAARHLTFFEKPTGSFAAQVWHPLREALTTPDAFAKHTYYLRQQNLLGPDDYTALLIEP